MIYINALNPNKILQGFNVSKIGTKVSIFSASRAKILIDKYLQEFTEVFDPFSGFSGRLLGAVASGKNYIGQDISEVHIRESKAMSKFLGIQNKISLDVADSKLTTGTYQSLIACPPYMEIKNIGMMFLWMNDHVMTGLIYVCKIFIVNDTYSLLTRPLGTLIMWSILLLIRVILDLTRSM
jgi:hypothetical protein